MWLYFLCLFRIKKYGVFVLYMVYTYTMHKDCLKVTILWFSWNYCLPLSWGTSYLKQHKEVSSSACSTYFHLLFLTSGLLVLIPVLWVISTFFNPLFPLNLKDSFLNHPSCLLRQFSYFTFFCFIAIDKHQADVYFMDICLHLCFKCWHWAIEL